jgi:Thaumatin family
MQETIWVAAASSAGHHALATSGWVLLAGASVSITIPDAWNGRFWGRTGCSFDSSGNGHCETGDCAGHFQCGVTWGAVPATLAEYNLNSYAGLDFYDVSLVDGANLPMWINHSGGTTPDTIHANGCSAAGCTKNAHCLTKNLSFPAL